MHIQPPRLLLPILKSQEGSVEYVNQSEVKVTILKRPDAVTVPPLTSNIQLKSTEDRGEAFKVQEQLIKVLKRPEVLPAEVSPSEEILNQNRVLVKSLKQREEEYAKARQRILGCPEEEVPSTSVELYSASVSESIEDDVVNVK